MSRTHESARLRLRGIGVAERERISISFRSFLIFSLSTTQNLCSSSTMRSQRFLQIVLSDKSRWVPISRSISPFASSFRTREACELL